MLRPLVATLMLIACTTALADSTSEQILKAKCWTTDSQGACTLYDVSLLELIAKPEAFHGKRVRLIGYVRLEFEGNAIYVSKESYEAAISKDALWLDPPAESPLARKGAKWGPRYAVVEGRFDAINQGHMGAFAGTITDTTRLDPWQGRR